jgi:hypothetical protein
MRLLRLPSVLLFPFLAFSGCNDDETAGPSGGEFTFSFSALPALGHGRFYEAWIGIPEAGALRHGIERISVGRFVVNADGSLGNLEGGPATFGLADPAVLLDAVEVLVTVEAEGASEAGPTLLGGEVTGDEDSAQAVLSTAYPHAVGADLATAAGGFVLATPTDGEGANETHGIWFADGAGAPSLTLPCSGTAGRTTRTCCTAGIRSPSARSRARPARTPTAAARRPARRPPSPPRAATSS